MDDAASLVSELIQKLSELEQKVEHHRQDMAAEFQRYSRELLHDVSSEVSAEVEKAIKDSMHNYPALGSALDDESPIRADSRKSHHNHEKDVSIDGDRKRRSRGSPPPLLPHTSGTPLEVAPRSPHEREREFQGLFTPIYLPLLDGTERRTRPDDLSPSTSPAALPLTQLQTGKLTQDHVQAERPSPPSILTKPVSRRPDPIRRYTDDSYTSDESISGSRRSALRRSSSSSNKTQSPRRVRFEVEGGEVLPTASPPMSPRSPEHQPSPLGNTTHRENVSSDSATIDDAEQDENGVELLGSSPPRPRKITSTDKLKAMTRNSKEDTSKWTVVGDLQELDEDEDVLMMGSRTIKPNASPQAEPAATADVLRQKTHTPVPSKMSQQLSEDLEDKHEDDEEDDGTNEEDEELAEMPPLISFKGRKTFSPPQSTANSVDGADVVDSTRPHAVINHPPAASKLVSDSSGLSLEDDEDELFDYESDEEENSPEGEKKQKSKSSKYIVEEDGEPEEESSRTAAAQPPVHLSVYSSSPAISISKTTATESTTPSRFTASIGSYKGKPYTMPSVVDEELYEQVAKMGDIPDFPGSVHDRSNVDASTSYRPDLPPISGTPKSFSQRLMMEEFLEAKKRASHTDGDKA